MNEFKVEVFDREYEGATWMSVRAAIDGDDLGARHYPISLWALADSLDTDGLYHNFLSCECGEAGCAGVDPIKVSQLGEIVEWRWRQGQGREQVWTFDRTEYVRSIESAMQIVNHRLKSETIDLLPKYEGQRFRDGWAG
jgi:hypothetical protein